MAKKFDEKRKFFIIRGIIAIIFIIIFIILGLKAIPVVNSMSTEAGRFAFKQKISNMGIRGPLYVLFIQIIQMIVAVIPGEPVEMAASLCFGLKGGILLCLVGFMIGSFIIFILSRSIGMGFIQLFVSKEKIDEIRNKSYFKNTAKFEAALFIIFIIPGLPKDIFLYAAGLSPVNMYRFLFLATFSRLPALIISNVAGQAIGNGKPWIAVLLYVGTLVFGLTVVYINSKLSKKKSK